VDNSDTFGIERRTVGGEAVFSEGGVAWLYADAWPTPGPPPALEKPADGDDRPAVIEAGYGAEFRPKTSTVRCRRWVRPRERVAGKAQPGSGAGEGGGNPVATPPRASGSSSGSGGGEKSGGDASCEGFGELLGTPPRARAASGAARIAMSGTGVQLLGADGSGYRTEYITVRGRSDGGCQGQ